MTKLISGFKDVSASLEGILGDKYISAVRSAYKFLVETPKEELRSMVGRPLEFVPDFDQADKCTFAKSYQKPTKDDILTGYGIFKITESKVLQIDWTGGHYQLPLGYHHPVLDDLLSSARKLGIVDDTHNNTPGMAVKKLSSQIVKCANAFNDEPLENIINSDYRLNRVTCVDTGTVAVGTGLKSILYHFRGLFGDRTPVFVMQEGNYHGTDFLEQRLRGMWEWLFTNIIVEFVEPNNINKLLGTFRKYENSQNEKIAAVVMEPVLMNNRAIYLRPEYVHKAKELCAQYSAILFLDEIQTCMWSPKIFMANEYGDVADMLAVGKGLTGGYSPLSFLICKRPLDNQDQYSSISTNGNADMSALAGLIVLEIVRNNSDYISDIGNYYFDELQRLQRRHPDKITEITGYRHLAGISFADEKLASRFHRACIEHGIFLRLQTYKERAQTIITKPPIVIDADDVDFVIGKLDKLLSL